MTAGWHFGEFEFRSGTGELRFRGGRSELQPQPARVLTLLIRRQGELVTREELRRLLWGDDVHVEYAQSINFCICQLRRALHDDAAQPRWIETLPRLGYRFVGTALPDSPLLEPATLSASVAPAPSPTSSIAETLPPPRRPARLLATFATLAAVAALLVLATLPLADSSPAEAPSVSTPIPLGKPSATRPALASDALAVYGRGLYLARRPGIDNVERGIALLREAVELAPEGAEPQVELAQALLARHRQSPSAQSLREAETAARWAVALAPDLASAQLARADAALQARYDWDAAESGYRAALRLDPGLAAAWSGYAALLAARGRFDDAIDAARHARELDPVCLAASADLGWYYYLARRYEEAIAASREALLLDPRHTLAHLTIIYSHLEERDEAAALAQANAHLAAFFAGSDRSAPKARNLRDYWRGSVEYLASSSRQSYLPPSDLALLELQLGEDEDGLRLLLRSCEDHAGRDLLFAAVDPRLDAWRRDPRLHRVLECLGLDGVRSI
ncbi:MAG: winged helix-turn-helix domain-containing protein [Thermoanaerobaculia bacterium]